MFKIFKRGLNKKQNLKLIAHYNIQKKLVQLIFYPVMYLKNNYEAVNFHL